MAYRKKPIKLFLRVLHLYFSKQDLTDNLVQKSYDRISPGYDETWTTHMRDLTADLIDRMDIKPNHIAIDLTCGTGYATGLIAERTSIKVTGVDRSQGMLTQAANNCPDNCQFIQADILEYLKTIPSQSADVITCCWGLGYSKPLKVLKQVKRILKQGGQVGIIDNTIFSLREVMYSSMLAFMENPDKLANLMKFRFLMGKKHLYTWFKLAGLKPQTAFASSKSYQVQSGTKAIEKLKATGAAAGFEYAASQEDSKAIFERFAQILEQKYMTDGHIPIVHRYAGGIATK